jgi:hypothetical protein
MMTPFVSKWTSWEISPKAVGGVTDKTATTLAYVKNPPRAPLGGADETDRTMTVEVKSDARALLRCLRDAGIRFTLTESKTLHYNAPDDILTEAQLRAIEREGKALLDLIEAFEERISIATYCGGLAPPEAEQVAWQCVLGESPEQPFAAVVPGPTEETT